MGSFETYLSSIENTTYRNKLNEIFRWIKDEFPELETRIAWNQPMFTHHGTFIISFSVSKKHIAVSPEKRGILEFKEDITKSGYDSTDLIFRIPWEKSVDFHLLKRIISFNIKDKSETTTFWRV